MNFCSVSVLKVRSLVGEELFSRYDRLLLQSTLDLMSGVFMWNWSCFPILYTPGWLETRIYTSRSSGEVEEPENTSSLAPSHEKQIIKFCIGFMSFLSSSHVQMWPTALATPVGRPSLWRSPTPRHCALCAASLSVSAAGRRTTEPGTVRRRPAWRNWWKQTFSRGTWTCHSHKVHEDVCSCLMEQSLHNF